MNADSLRRRVLSLGAAKGFETATQFALPMVLARCLDAATFGEYRLFWLAVGTVMALASLDLPHTMFYFLSRGDAPTRRLHVRQSLVLLAITGAVCALYLLPWNPLLPDALAALSGHGAWVPLFVLLWVPAQMLDCLPMAEERVRCQAAIIVGFAAARSGLIAAAACFTGELGLILCLLVLLAVAKLAVLAFYVRRHHDGGGKWMDRRALVEQLRFAAPLAAVAALFSLRVQADQWIAASLFPLHAFAAFSIAVLLAPLVGVVRQAVSEVLLPRMGRLQAAGAMAQALHLNGRGNVLVATLLYPLLGVAFVFAEELITVVYTADYIAAAPVMRVYIVGMFALAVEYGSLIGLLRIGRFAMGISVFTLALSIAVSWCGAHCLGLAGAAAGSVLALYADRALILGKVAALAQTPLARLQDWQGLALLFACTSAAAGLAWGVVGACCEGAGASVRVCVGGTTLVLAFLILRQLLFKRRLLPVAAAIGN